MKTVVYGWRLSPKLKSDLQRAARSRQVTVSTILNLAVREWLAKYTQETAADEEQERLHANAERFIGVFASGNYRGSQTVRESVRKRLSRKHGS
jgi:predicted transcriptional regulator